MKNIFVAISSLVILTLSSSALSEAENPWFVGGMLGDSTIDIGSRYTQNLRDYFDDDQSLGRSVTRRDDTSAWSLLINGGYYFQDWLAIEGVIATSLASDEVYNEVLIDVDGAYSNYTLDATSGERVGRDTVPSEAFEISSTSVGVYAMFQAGAEAYVKARVGVANSSVKIEASKSATFSSAGLSFGVTVGQQFGPGSIEFTFMRFPDVKVNRVEFAESFASQQNDGTGLTADELSDLQATENLEIGEGKVTMRRSLVNEMFTLGYVYRF